MSDNTQGTRKTGVVRLLEIAGEQRGLLILAAAGAHTAVEGASSAMTSAISPPMALAFIFAFFFNVPCMAAIAAANTELHSGKWTILIVLYYVCVALLLGGAAYYVGLLIF
jgi:ferrous iron transport protein B